MQQKIKFSLCLAAGGGGECFLLDYGMQTN